jgi:DNA-binding transcriptional ArsR family regulator
MLAMAKRLMPEAMIEVAARRFAVLSDANRLRLIGLLMNSGERPVGELAEELGTSQANVSKHLKTLHDAGIVGRRQEGTAVYYSVVDPSIRELCDIVCARIGSQAREHAKALAG